MTVRRLRSARAVAWSPHVLTRSVWRAAWDSDRSDLIDPTPSNGATVTTWTDYLQGIAPTMATEASKPAYDSAGAYPVITAAAGSRYLSATITSGQIPTGTDTSCVFAVVQGFTTGNIWNYGGTTAASTRRISLDGAGVVTLGVGSSGNGYLVNATASLVAPTILTAIMTATYGIFRINGVEVGRVTVAMPTTTAARIRFFANTNSTPGSFGDGAISDVHITTSLSDSDILRFEGWLAHKRGITLQGGHPYASAPP